MLRLLFALFGWFVQALVFRRLNRRRYGYRRDWFGRGFGPGAGYGPGPGYGYGPPGMYRNRGPFGGGFLSGLLGGLGGAFLGNELFGGPRGDGSGGFGGDPSGGGWGGGDSGGGDWGGGDSGGSW